MSKHKLERILEEKKDDSERLSSRYEKRFNSFRKEYHLEYNGFKSGAKIKKGMYETYLSYPEESKYYVNFLARNLESNKLDIVRLYTKKNPLEEIKRVTKNRWKDFKNLCTLACQNGEIIETEPLELKYENKNIKGVSTKSYEKLLKTYLKKYSE